MYKGKSTKITADFSMETCSMETLKSRRAWSEVLWAPNENNFTLPSKTIIQNCQSNKNLP
jgi:hypothetical protein